MNSNFEFLQDRFAMLFQLGFLAEKYLYTDANSCLIKLGMMGETIVNLMLKLDGINPPETDNTHANRIRFLKKEGLLPRDIDDILYALRTTRNDAIHANFEDTEKCKTLLEMSHTLSVWFMQTYGDWSFAAAPFILPTQDTTDYNAIIKEKEAVIADLSTKMNNISTQNISNLERRQQANKAALLINLSEKETRYLIDEQLRQVGWEADTEIFRYAKGTRPQKGRNIAIAEWPTDSRISQRGAADYALFVGLRLVAFVEAKRAFIDVSSIIDSQCRDYASNVKAEHDEYAIGKWQEYKVPFVFATNGRKYLEQYKEKSGIWFLDLRDETSRAKPLRGWVSPQGIMEWLEKDTAAANKKLQASTKDLLTDKDGLNLREYQIEAIEAAENAIIQGSEKALLSMATGTGKTRTILGMIYRFLQSGRFRRILFLVDRTALGEQAQDVFKEVKLEDAMTLDGIYNIKNLEDKDFDPETKIQVATVQSLVKRIMYNTGEKMPAVSDYDLIIVDEAHRGYVLDKEAGEEELLYRNQDDFMSKYRTVIEYFDAVKVALTATPALHTTEIFGKPVFDYSYRRAVVEGYLIDHDAPHNLTTKLSEEGITYEKGEIVPVYDPVTGEIVNSAELEDELRFDVEQFNRKVITANFNRAVLQEISEYINPMGQGKTLIYAVDDNHADMIVNILREIYEPMGISSKAIMKITGKSGDKKRVLELIREYKNEEYPNIAVTVDLLTTGIDVPEITTLVFMRRVKSRILYEQMLGRATRLCDRIGKTHFEIFDPVGVYESLQEVSNMKPVVANANANFIDLLDGLESLNTEAQISNQIDLIVAKLRRKRLDKRHQEHFENMADGKTPAQFMEYLRTLPLEKSKNLLLQKRELFAMLNEGGVDARRAVVISDKEDNLITHTRGYGKGQKPQDYLEEFRIYITENADKLEALKLVFTRPAELTREALKSLRLELDLNGFTETQLNSAWKETTNQEIAADIISFIRSQAVGSQLLGHNERIQKAVAKLKSSHSFSKMELDWLDRVEKFLLTETVLSEETFNLGAFRDFGGFTRIDKLFKNKLKDYIAELNQYLYDDGGRVA